MRSRLGHILSNNPIEGEDSMCDGKEEKDEMIAKQVDYKKPDFSKMSKEDRMQFIREQTNRICNRNDEALRRLSKN